MKFLIIGLGNVGSEYENTRHNIGFSILDHLVSELSVSFVEEKYGYYAEIQIKILVRKSLTKFAKINSERCKDVQIL